MVTREQRDEIVRLALLDMPRPVIAAKTGLSVKTIYEQIAAARRRGVAIRRHYQVTNPDTRARVHVDQHVLDRLQPDAERRDMTVRELAAELLATVAASGLVDAVLDDGGADGHP